MMMIIQLAQFSHNFVIDSCLHSLTQMELCFWNWQSHKGANRPTIKKQQFAWQASPLDIIIKVYINSSQEFHAYLTLLSSIFFHTSKCAFCKRRVVHAAWIFLTLEKKLLKPLHLQFLQLSTNWHIMYVCLLIHKQAWWRSTNIPSWIPTIIDTTVLACCHQSILHIWSSLVMIEARSKRGSMYHNKGSGCGTSMGS